MRIGSFRDPPMPEEGIELIKYPVEHGIAFLNAADVYGPHKHPQEFHKGQGP